MENGSLYSIPKSCFQRWKANSPSASEMRNKTEHWKLENKIEYLSRKQLLRKVCEQCNNFRSKTPSHHRALEKWITICEMIISITKNHGWSNSVFSLGMVNIQKQLFDHALEKSKKINSLKTHCEMSWNFSKSCVVISSKSGISKFWVTQYSFNVILYM